ncbi:MAG: tetratricopeptide repeat protein [Candidatus Gastranaerophilales bacterium]|nr:tetratricopeptide repeat protein [Candidatus Gastranaerophilales bacterium]
MKKGLKYSLAAVCIVCLLTANGFANEKTEQPTQKIKIEKTQTVNLKKYNSLVEAGRKEVYNPKVLSLLRKYVNPDLSKFDFSKGLKTLDKAIDINPDGYEAYAYKAELLGYKGDASEAAVNAKKALSINPRCLEANYTLGALYLYNTEEYDKAIESFQKVVSLDSKNADAYYNIGYAYIEKNNDRKALEYLTNAITIDPLYDCAYYKRAQAYCKLKEYNNAINDLSVLIKRNPKVSDYYFRRSACYSAMNNMPKTLADINKVVKLEPNNAESYLRRLRIYTLISASKQMIDADMKKVEQLSSQNEEQLTKLMLMYFDYDKNEDTIRIANEILKINPQSIKAYYGLARANVGLKKYSLALEYLDKYAVDMSLMDNAYYAYRAFARLGVAGRTDKELIKNAIADLSKSIELGSNVSTCYLYRGSAKIIIGDYKSGYEDIQKYISMVDVPCVLALHQMGYAEKMASYQAIKYDANGKFVSWSRLSWENDIDEYGSIIKKNPHDISAIINNSSDNIIGLKYAASRLLVHPENLAVVNKCKVRYTSDGCMTYLITSPYINALGDKGQTQIDTTYVVADIYKEVLTQCLHNLDNVPLLSNGDIDNFYRYVTRINQNDAIDMIRQVVSLTGTISEYSGNNADSYIGMAKQLYLKAIDYLETNQLCAQSAISKKIMTESCVNLAQISCNCDNNVDLMKTYFDKAVMYGYPRKDANKYIANVYVDMGDTALDNDNENDAIYYYNMAVQYGFPKFEVYKQIAWIYMDSRNWFKASEYCTKALSIKKDKRLFYARGLAKKNMNDYSGALGDFGNALKLDKNYSDVIWERADIYFDRKQYAQAMADYKHYASLNKKSGAAVYNIATCLYNQKQKKAAYPYYAKAKGLYQAQGDESGYNSCVRMMNRINGYYY